MGGTIVKHRERERDRDRETERQRDRDRERQKRRQDSSLLSLLLQQRRNTTPMQRDFDSISARCLSHFRLHSLTLTTLSPAVSNPVLSVCPQLRSRRDPPRPTHTHTRPRPRRADMLRHTHSQFALNNKLSTSPSASFPLPDV